MKKSKLLTSLAAVGIAFMMLPQSVYAAGFIPDAAGVKYQNDDGSFLTNAWVQVGQNIYHLDANGLVQTGWIQVDNLWYLLDANGVCTNPTGTATPPAEALAPAASAPAAATAAAASAQVNPAPAAAATAQANPAPAAATAQISPEASAQSAALQEQPSQITYVLNKNTKKFHKPTCKSVKTIKPSNREDSELSREEIIGMGYKACKNCGG